jgi:hypothetical protein
MVAVGWAWQEEGGYGLVGQVTGHLLACCWKDFDVMRGSKSGHGFHFPARL